MHAVNGIHDIRLIDQLHKSFCKPNARSPKWLYTKSETPKKISDSIDVDKDLLEKYRQFMKIDPKSLDFMIQFMPDVVVDECNRFKQDIEKMPDKYNTFIEQGGSNVSGGQKQRLCIARALLKKPKILILDDSTSAVDTATDARIREAFGAAIPGTTKIIIAQRISSVAHADQIIILEDGRVNAVGSHETLLASNQIYQDIYHSQQEGVGL